MEESVPEAVSCKEAALTPAGMRGPGSVHLPPGSRGIAASRTVAGLLQVCFTDVAPHIGVCERGIASAPRQMGRVRSSLQHGPQVLPVNIEVGEASPVLWTHRCHRGDLGDLQGRKKVAQGFLETLMTL